MDPSFRLAFDRIFRKFDEIEARWDLRFPDTRDVREQRAEDLRVGVPQQIEDEVVADNWGGLFEPAASNSSSPPSMMEQLGIDAPATEEIELEEYPHQIHEVEVELQDDDIATLEEALSKREDEMQVLTKPPRLHASLFALEPGTGVDSLHRAFARVRDSCAQRDGPSRAPPRRRPRRPPPRPPWLRRAWRAPPRRRPRRAPSHRCGRPPRRRPWRSPLRPPRLRWGGRGLHRRGRPPRLQVRGRRRLLRAPARPRPRALRESSRDPWWMHPLRCLIWRPAWRFASYGRRLHQHVQLVFKVRSVSAKCCERNFNTCRDLQHHDVPPTVALMRLTRLVALLDAEFTELSDLKVLIVSENKLAREIAPRIDILFATPQSVLGELPQLLPSRCSTPGHNRAGSAPKSVTAAQARLSTLEDVTDHIQPRYFTANLAYAYSVDGAAVQLCSATNICHIVQRVYEGIFAQNLVQLSQAWPPPMLFPCLGDGVRIVQALGLSFSSGTFLSVKYNCSFKCSSLQYVSQLLLAVGTIQTNCYLSGEPFILLKFSSDFSGVHSLEAATNESLIFEYSFSLGEANLIVAIQVTKLALKDQQNKQLQQQIVVWFEQQPWTPSSQFQVLAEQGTDRVVVGNLFAPELGGLWPKLELPWPPPESKGLWFQLPVSYMPSCAVHQCRVTLFHCMQCQEGWKYWLKSLQGVVHDEINHRETVHWLQSFWASANFWSCKLQSMPIILLHLIRGRRAMLLLSVSKWDLIHAYMLKQVSLVGATLMETGILQITIMCCSCRLLALVAVMDGLSDLTVAFNYLHTCGDCNSPSILVNGKYLISASLLRTNLIASKLRTCVACSCQWVSVCSPVIGEKNLLEVIRKNRKNNVALAVVYLGRFDDARPEKLEAVVAAASGASSLEFGVDSILVPKLVLALQISREDERVSQEAAEKQAREKSPKTESACFTVLVCLPNQPCSRLLWKPPGELLASVEIIDDGLDDVVADEADQDYGHEVEDTVQAGSTMQNATAPPTLPKDYGRHLLKKELHNHVIIQFTWDPGDFVLLHRLGGKPNLKEGGMSGSIHSMGRHWAMGLGAYWAISSTFTT